MTDIGIGIVGGGYMGKAHAVAMGAVGAVFATRLQPRLEMVCATSAESAERYRATYGFRRGTADWRELVDDPKVEAVVIASPQSTHREIAEAAFARGKPVFCEKPLGADIDDSRAMTAAAKSAAKHESFETRSRNEGAARNDSRAGARGRGESARRRGDRPVYFD